MSPLHQYHSLCLAGMLRQICSLLQATGWAVGLHICLCLCVCVLADWMSERGSSSVQIPFIFQFSSLSDGTAKVTLNLSTQNVRNLQVLRVEHFFPPSMFNLLQFITNELQLKDVYFLPL